MEFSLGVEELVDNELFEEVFRTGVSDEILGAGLEVIPLVRRNDSADTVLEVIE